MLRKLTFSTSSSAAGYAKTGQVDEAAKVLRRTWGDLVPSNRGGDVQNLYIGLSENGVYSQ